MKRFLLFTLSILYTILGMNPAAVRAGAWTRLVWRTAPKNELVLEISEQHADGRRFDRRLVFKKQ